MFRCPNCGTETDGRFCPKCGQAYVSRSLAEGKVREAEMELEDK